MSDFSIIGKPTAMIDAAGKTTGAGKYTDDLSVPGMLVGKILHSPYPHARIKRIKISRAEKLAGVVAVSETIAERALELIDVDYEVLPAYFDPEESMKAKTDLIHDNKPGN